VRHLKPCLKGGGGGLTTCLNAAPNMPLGLPNLVRDKKKLFSYPALSTITEYIQGGSNMTGTDLYVNKPHCAAAVRP